MNLLSLSCFIFIFIFLIIYFIVPKKMQWIILLIASMIFLFYGNFTIFTFLQVFIILFSAYIFGKKIEENYNTKKAKIYLILGILFILLILGYLKYTNLILETLNFYFQFFKIDKYLNLVQHNSLLGISYYSLIMISYLVDVYRGATHAEKNIFKLALFMSYFPILTSGPFVRFENMKEELYSVHRFNYNRMCRGLVRIGWGFFKILVISQRLSYFVDTVYSNTVTFNGCFCILAILFFPLQLYTNFSGSIDIIMGISEIIGINLPENFTAPFFSRTITEFWRNWHITLGVWLKDYIFYPLLKSNIMQNLNKKLKNKYGKKVGKLVSLYLSMFIMWLVIGIWHGGSYSFIIGSGLIPFICIFLEDILEPISKKINKKLGFNRDTFSYHLYQSIRTYLLFSVAMIFFRATSVMQGLRIIKSAFEWNPWILFDNQTLYHAGLDMFDFRVLLISLLILFIVEILSKKGNVRDMLFRQNIVFRWIIYFSLIFAIIIFGCYGVGYNPAQFIYGGF